MSQNTSHAVMSQRHEAHDSLDFFPTPLWATRALCEFIITHMGPTSYLKVWEPACGHGHMARPLAEYFLNVHASDVCDYSQQWPGQDRVCDFLFPGSEPPHITAQGIDWIITNPPFRLAKEFALTGITKARRGVALLVRTAFLESADRYNDLFNPHPPAEVLQFVERVPMVKGRVDKAASTATAYCWIIWAVDGYLTPTRFHWIAPCRARLEREGDYTNPLKVSP